MERLPLEPVDVPAEFPTVVDRAGRRLDFSVWNDVRALPAAALIGGLNCLGLIVVANRYSGATALRVTTNSLWLATAAAGGLVLLARFLLISIEKRPASIQLRLFLASAGLWPIVALLMVVRTPFPVLAAGLAVSTGLMCGIGVVCWKGSPLHPVAASVANRSPPDDLTVPSAASRLVAEIPAIEGFSEKWEGAAPADPRTAEQRGLAGASSPRVPVSRIAAEATARRSITVAARTEPERGMVSWMKRAENSTLGETLSGAQLVSFSANQSWATMHVPFWPAFPTTPRFQAEVLDCISVRIKSSTVFPFGARLELKRSGESTSPIQVQVLFHATTGDSAQRAA